MINTKKLKEGELVFVADKTQVINIGMPENAVGIEEEGNVVRYIEK